jgi:hypothetical protein
MALPNSWEALVNSWPPELRKAFLDAVAAIRDRAQVKAIADRLERGDVEGALEAAGIDPAAFAGYASRLGDAYQAGGNATAARIPALSLADGYRLKVLFDVRAPRAEAYLRSSSSQKVVEITTDMRAAVRAHLTTGMVRGQNPITVALDLVGRVSQVTGKREGGVIGLTDSQRAWAQTYQDAVESADWTQAMSMKLRDKSFDKTIRKSIREGKPVPKETIDKMVRAYRNRALRYRAQTIARTEALTSLHAGQHEAMLQAIEKGQVAAQDVEKIWRSSADSRVRDTHVALNGTGVNIMSYFETTAGNRLMFPGDPEGAPEEIINCRCYMEHKINYLRTVT